MSIDNPQLWFSHQIIVLKKKLYSLIISSLTIPVEHTNYGIFRILATQLSTVFFRVVVTQIRNASKVKIKVESYRDKSKNNCTRLSSITKLFL